MKKETKQKISKTLSEKYESKSNMIIKLYDEGYKVSEIITILKCSPNTVYKYIKKII